MIFNTQRADITRRRFYHASDVTIVGHATTHTPIYMYSCFYASEFFGDYEHVFLK